MQIAPIAREQGVGPDINAYLAVQAELSDNTDAKKFISFAEPSMGDGATELPHNPSLPGQTDRTYRRVSEARGQPEQPMAQPMGEPSMNGQMVGI